MKKINLEERAQLIGEYVSPKIYASGLIRLAEYLMVDLSDLLEIEGRRFGIVLSYLNSIYQECQKMEISEDEMLLDKLYQGLKYGRVLSKN